MTIPTGSIYMKAAIKQAELARRKGETPVGAVVVKEGAIISRGHNLREGKHLATAHAEIIAIDRACKKLGAWRLEGCDLYVTLEPCPMCMGAIINARIKNVYFGAYDPKAGCCGSIIDLSELPFNHRVNVLGGCMQADCSELLTSFFKQLREAKKKD